MDSILEAVVITEKWTLEQIAHQINANAGRDEQIAFIGLLADLEGESSFEVQVIKALFKRLAQCAEDEEYALINALRRLVPCPFCGGELGEPEIDHDDVGHSRCVWDCRDCGGSEVVIRCAPEGE